MPVLRQPPRHRGPRLPPGERVPALNPPTPAAGGGLDEDAALAVLAQGTIEVLGRLDDASNATLLASVSLDGVDHLAVYKPTAGERPLWDFPTGTLGAREAAAYALSRAAGWDVVPPTLVRDDAPFGPGSLQWWLDAGDDADGDPLVPEPGAELIDIVPPSQVPPGWLRVLDAEDGRGRPVVLTHADDPVLRSLALFDAVANNADRKGGHVLAGRLVAPAAARSEAAEGPVSVRGIDHGLTFHPDPKLRTVLWGWAGRRFDDTEAATLGDLAEQLEAGAAGPLAPLVDLLSAEDVSALRTRLTRLRRAGRFPRPLPGMPPIPWPPF
ncbi:MAG: SCO1664 family protein [Kineosporiaceae bacterium]